MMLRSPNQYPTNIYGHWHYFRRAPAAYRSFDDPIYSKASLKTTALEIPRVRRDAMTEAGQSLLGIPCGAFRRGKRARNALRSHPLQRRQTACARTRVCLHTCLGTRRYSRP